MLKYEAAKVEHAYDILVVRSFLVQGLRLIEVVFGRFPILIERPLLPRDRA